VAITQDDVIVAGGGAGPVDVAQDPPTTGAEAQAHTAAADSWAAAYEAAGHTVATHGTTLVDMAA
jgi:hypothetical protein